MEEKELIEKQDPAKDEKELSENPKPAKTEAALTEKRAALIAVLIAVPSAVLISMLIHFFVAIPSEPMFNCGAQVSEPGGAQREASPQKKGQRRAPGAVQQGAKRDLTTLYKEKITLSKEILKGMSKASFQEQVTAQANVLLAEGELYRYENRIRVWGEPASDIAVRYEAAQKISQKLEGTKKDIDAAAMTALDLEIKLKSHRVFSNPEWQKAYQAYRKNPNVETYRAMLSAEQEAQPRRRR